MESLFRSVTGANPNPSDYEEIDFWSNPQRTGWLTKQGEYIKTWRRRWFILKQGKLLWFKDPSSVTRAAIPRGVVSVAECLTVKGAEDVINKPFAFELSTSRDTMYFIADFQKLPKMSFQSWLLVLELSGLQFLHSLNSIDWSMIASTDLGMPFVQCFENQIILTGQTVGAAPGYLLLFL